MTTDLSEIPIPTPPPAASFDGPVTTVADLLRRAAANWPDSTIQIVSARPAADDPERFSYPDLLARARRVAAGLRHAPTSPAGRVALLVDRPREFLPVFWGCLLAGQVPCVIPTGSGDPDVRARLLRYLDTLLDRPLVVAAEERVEEVRRAGELAVIGAEELIRAGSPAAGDPDVVAPSPEDVALLVLTSGSTGAAKAVRLTHANLLAAMAAKARVQQATAADVYLNWISYDHVAALLECHLLPMSVGACQVQVEPDVVLEDPGRFLELADTHRVTVTFTPNFLFGQLVGSFAEDPRRDALDLSALRTVISGGEAVVTETATAFLDLLAPSGLRRDVLVPAFGMTETCAGSVYSYDFPAADEGSTFAALGRPVPGLRMRIAGEDGPPVVEGEVGELQLSGPMVFAGYLDNPAANAAAFTADGWFRTGDLGRIDDGRLTLVGRSKDSIIVNGVNYFSQDLEPVLEELDGVRRSYVAAFPTRPPGADTEQLVVAFVPDTAATGPAHAAELHRVVTAIRGTTIMQWGFRPAVILPLTVEDMPKTSLGKIQRTALRRRLEAGDLADREAEVAALTQAQLGGYTAPQGRTETALAALYAEMFDLDPATLSATASFFDIGGTSLDILRLKRWLELRMGVCDLPVSAILLAPTVRELATRIDAGAPATTAAYDPLVPLQLTGTRTPLFCVHPGVGEVLVFVNLAKYFTNERPFYALRARGFNPGEPHFTDFAEMVGCYVDAIRRVQPHGPYAVAGYSYGGAVAFEIAKVLEAAGERVDFVGIFNLPPHIKYRMNQLDVTEGAINLAFFLSLITGEQAAELPAQLRPLPLDDQMRALVALAPEGRMDELDLDLAGFTAWAALAQSLLTMGRSYEPSGAVDSLTVFYAIPLVGTKEDWLRDQLRKWDGFARSENRYVDVPGEHYTLMGPRHVARFQAILRAELDRSLDGR